MSGAMTNGREKRLLLGFLALLAPLPLPFNDAVRWPLIMVYALFVAYFIQRADRDPPRWLPNWALNILALVYLPLLVLDLQRGVQQSGFLEPLLHLLLFLVVVKLYSLRREADKWHTLIAVFFLFTGAMATSSHLTVTFYLLAFFGLSLVVLARFAHLYVLGGLGQERHAPASFMPVRTPVVVTVVLGLLLAVVLFAMIPRVNDPYVFGRGAGMSLRSAGMGDSVDLNATSAIRGNRAVVLRLRLEDGVPPAEWRFKGATYDEYRAGRWGRASSRRDLRPLTGPVRFHLAEGIPPSVNTRAGASDPETTALIYMTPLRNSSLIVPIETRWVDQISVPTLFRDAGGGVMLPSPPDEAFSYRVTMDPQPVIAAERHAEAWNASLDTTGVSDAMRAHAARVMGEGDDHQRVARLLAHLLREYSYTTDFVDRASGEPLDDFLFVNQRGHCELFASAMVLLLRAEGIPARFVAGFLDAEHNPLQDYFIVRQDNAHAWVEAYTPTYGWRVYDPTPPEGRPSAADWNLRLAMTQFYDSLIFRWDRYVLSFSAEDQASVLDRVRDAAGTFWDRLRRLWRGDDEPAADNTTPFPDEGSAALSPGEIPERRPWGLLLVVPLLIAAAIGWWAWRRRTPMTATAAYRQLRGWVAEEQGAQGVARAAAKDPARADIPGLADEALAPLRVAHVAARRYPGAARAAGQLVTLYLEESFAQRTLSGDERRRALDALDTVRAARDATRREARRQRRGVRRRGSGTRAA